MKKFYRESRVGIWLQRYQVNLLRFFSSINDFWKGRLERRYFLRKKSEFRSFIRIEVVFEPAKRVVKQTSDLHVQAIISTIKGTVSVISSATLQRWQWTILKDTMNNFVWPHVINLRLFKQWILLDQIMYVWNIKSLHYQVAKIEELENMTLW